MYVCVKYLWVSKSSYTEGLCMYRGVFARGNGVYEAPVQRGLFIYRGSFVTPLGTSCIHMHILVLFLTDMGVALQRPNTDGALQSSYIERDFAQTKDDFHIEREFVRPLGTSYTHTYTCVHISVFFPSDMGALQGPYVEGLCIYRGGFKKRKGFLKAHIERMICKAFRGFTKPLEALHTQRGLFTHIYTFWPFSYRYWWCCKEPYTEAHSQSHI